jgi:hypothetical protein
VQAVWRYERRWRAGLGNADAGNPVEHYSIVGATLSICSIIKQQHKHLGGNKENAARVPQDDVSDRVNGDGFRGNSIRHSSSR